MGWSRRLLFFWAIVLLVGSCRSLPPRSPIEKDKVRQFHYIDGQLYRGRPWWKRNQQLRVGQEYKPVKDELRSNPKPAKIKKKRQRRKFLWWWI